MMNKIIRRFPLLDKIRRKLYSIWLTLPSVFNSSKSYWIKRYQAGGSSGYGSYNKLARFKAEVLNQFVSNKNIESVIEYGCGDGNQLKLFNFPSYIGFDVSPEVLAQCRDLFSEDDNKSFKLVDNYNSETADLTLSLDVIFHLIEDHIFSNYMHRLFDSSQKFVIIYSSNIDKNSIIDGAHVRHRKFTDWVSRLKPEWKLVKHIPNKYPLKDSIKNGSLSDFFIYQRQENVV